MKKLIPTPWKIHLRLLHRHWSDRLTGQWQQLAHHRAMDADTRLDFQPQITLSQPLGSAASHHLANKKHNLALAIQQLQDVIIAPGQIFSFWHLVGHPNTKAGYVQGRTITGEALTTTVGGGLCQLSGLVYFLALKGGLTILERHPHSKDIYTDATRFTPLGSDATVVYGHKDLRFQNSLAFPICIRFFMSEQDIQVCLCASEAIAESRIEFRSQLSDLGDFVETIRYTPSHPQGERMSLNLYPKLRVPAHLS
jgi:vancomycin resistance protein VanW